ncbi:MAG: hypothetical protein AAEJ43_12640 [Gammaproteobacteria bacterium]
MKPSHYALAAILAVQPLVGGAFTPEDHLAWLKANQSAQPQFVDGDTITFENADLIRPFIPAEQQEELIFEGMEMTIKDAGDLSPAESFQTTTKQYYGHATVDADGAFGNYAAGRPFDPEKFTPGSKEDGWNRSGTGCIAGRTTA